MKAILKNLNTEYINYIRDNKKITDENLRRDFINLLKTENLEKRKILWEGFTVNINSIKQVPELANPYFIGFGNPESKVLFIGKEKAFSMTSSPHLLLQESINNILHWQLIANGKDSVNFEFNPKNPRSYHKGKLKTRHTWGKYAQVLVGLKDKELDLKELLKDNSESSQNIFEHCFMTEVNHLPSKYSKGKRLISERKELLKNEFYKGFDVVIIGAKKYLNDEEIKEIFKIKESKKDVLLGTKGRNNNIKITCDIYKSDSQFIVYCQQLSGASGWTNKALDNLTKLLKTKSISSIKL